MSLEVVTVNNVGFKFELINDRPMVSSLAVVKHFEKRHDNFLRTIQNDPAFEEFYTNRKIAASEYIDNSGKRNKFYWLDRDAFSYFVMGFTGEKAKEWKLNYIRAFNLMEQKLKEKQKTVENLSPMEILENFFKVSKDHEKRLEHLEKTKRLETWQEKRLKDAVDHKVITLCNGDMSKRSMMYKKVWKAVKDRFMVPRYSEIPSVEFQNALDFVKRIKMIDLLDNI